MKTARPLPQEFEGRPFTVAEARLAGVKPKRLRHASLRILYDDEVTLVDGLPVTTPERTWLDMAEMLSVDDLQTHAR